MLKSALQRLVISLVCDWGSALYPKKLSGELKINYIFNLGCRKKAQASTVLKSSLLEHTYILS